MSSWRDRIISELDPNVSSLFVVRDPDDLLAEEKILEAIRERGFEFARFDDPIALRFAYESRYRTARDRGEEANLVIATKSSGLDGDDLPFDILKGGRILSVGLADLFPKVSYQVVSKLEQSDLDTLFAAQEKHSPQQMGENVSTDFVLRHVFGIAPELILSSEDLLLILLRRHYGGRHVPAMFDDRLVQLLNGHDRFAEWPLARLLSDREYFFAFLQERWLISLDLTVAEQDPDRVSEGPSYALTCEGPRAIPFDHPDIHVYIDNLFLEGILKPIRYEHSDLLVDSWYAVGIVIDEAEDQRKRFERLIGTLRDHLPNPEARYDKWLHYSRTWAEGVVLLSGPGGRNVGQDELAEYNVLQRDMDARFAAWLARRYDALMSLPPYPPVMVHHIPRFLAREREANPGSRIALLVVDGMAMDQWLAIRTVLENSDADLSFHEQAVFAWVPSTTSVSRQALFSGLVPRLFPTSINTTDREPALWEKFWADRGVGSSSVAYQRGLGDGFSEEINEVLDRPKLRVVGLVIDKVDKIMHGMELGTAGMHNQVRQWVNEGFLLDLFNALFERGFRVFVTSDHGNVAAIGCGRPQEGAIAETRGERVRVYSDRALRSVVSGRYSAALAWNSSGLPEGYWPLLAPARQAFTTEGHRTVAHGGISLEEIIVPFVEIQAGES